MDVQFRVRMRCVLSCVRVCERIVASTKLVLGFPVPCPSGRNRDGGFLFVASKSAPALSVTSSSMPSVCFVQF